MAQKQRVPESLRREVRERAAGRCEYCLIAEDDANFPFEADHIIAEVHGGETVSDNLAWACLPCNRAKGTNISSIDPVTGRLVYLYHPRRQQWRRHFRINGAHIEPLTASGRVTIVILRLNDPERVDERRSLMALGRFPAR